MKWMLSKSTKNILQELMLILPALSPMGNICPSNPLGKEVGAQTQMGIQVRSHIAMVMENFEGQREAGLPQMFQTSEFFCGLTMSSELVSHVFCSSTGY